MTWKVSESRAGDGKDAWIVTVLEEDGSLVGEVRVRIAERAGETDRTDIVSVRESEGRVAVQQAITADPTTLPAEILVGLEGNQPIMPGKTHLSQEDPPT